MSSSSTQLSSKAAMKDLKPKKFDISNFRGLANSSPQ